MQIGRPKLNNNSHHENFEEQISLMRIGRLKLNIDSHQVDMTDIDMYNVLYST